MALQIRLQMRLGHPDDGKIPSTNMDVHGIMSIKLFIPRRFQNEFHEAT